LIHLKYNFVNDKYLKLIIFLSFSSSPVGKKFPFGFFKKGGLQEITAQVLKFHRKWFDRFSNGGEIYKRGGTVRNSLKGEIPGT